MSSYSKKNQWSWIFYDWANSAFATTVMAGFFPLFFKNYYSQGTDPTVSTAQLGIANSVATLFIALLSPWLGSLADQFAWKKKFLLAFCFLGSLSTASLFLVQAGQWPLAIFLFVIASFGFASSCSFYDSLLPDISPKQDYDKISALGYSFGYLGGGLLFTLNVLMYQKPNWFGISDGTTAVKLSFLSVGAWWILFTIPLMIWVKEKKDDQQLNEKLNFIKSLKKVKITFLDIKKDSRIFFFLIGFLLYNDGVGTTIKMAVDYGSSIGLNAGDLITALLMVQFIGFPAAYAFGVVTKKIPIKLAISICIAVYSAAVIWAYQMTQAWEFFFLAGVIGLVQGGIQSLSRSLFASLIPEEKAGEYFGFYNLMGKFAGFIGPTLMGLTALITGSNRLGILSVLILFFSGWYFFNKYDKSQNSKLYPINRY